MHKLYIYVNRKHVATWAFEWESDMFHAAFELQRDCHWFDKQDWLTFAHVQELS